jgi:hypothetical protein
LLQGRGKGTESAMVEEQPLCIGIDYRMERYLKNRGYEVSDGDSKRVEASP